MGRARARPPHHARGLVVGAVVLAVVVAVVVAHDPGPWFERTLASLRDSTYPDLAVVVVDAGSAAPVAERVAQAVLQPSLA